MKACICSILVGMCLFLSPSAFALTIDEVTEDGLGAPDILLNNYTSSPSNPVTELSLFAEALDMDVSDWHLRVYDFDNVDYGWEYLTGDLYSFDFGPDSGNKYFLLKTGKIGNQSDYYNYFIYENVGSLRYGVIDLGEFGDETITIGSIGHLVIPNPEPSTLLLLSAGILGLVLYRRKLH